MTNLDLALLNLHLFYYSIVSNFYSWPQYLHKEIFDLGFGFGLVSILEASDCHGFLIVYPIKIFDKYFYYKLVGLLALHFH